MSFVSKSKEGAFARIMAIGQDLSEVSELRLTQEKKSALMGMLSHELRSPSRASRDLSAPCWRLSTGRSWSDSWAWSRAARHGSSIS